MRVVSTLWLSLLAATPVTIATGTSSTACGARHALMGTLRQVPRLSATWVDDRGTADARTVRGRWTVIIDGHQGEGPDLEHALRRAWPSTRTPLPEGLVAPPYPLLSLACEGRVAEAYRRAGAAVPWALATIAPPPDREAQGPLLRRWASARGQAAAGRSKVAIRELRTVVKRMVAGATGPIWRAETTFEDPPEATVIGGRVLLFDNGTFEARSLKTGEVLWRRALGPAEPKPVALNAETLLLVLDDGVEAIAAHTGQPRWRTALKAPRPQIATKDGDLFVADAEAVTAIDITTGDARWQYDGLLTPVAGPVLTGHHLAVPMGPVIAVLNPKDGVEAGRIDVGDELSAPLIAAADGGLWAFVGSDDVVFVPAARTTVGRRFEGLPGAAWPPAVVGGRLAVVAGTGTGPRRLVVVDARRGRRKTAARGVRPPLATIAGGDRPLIVHTTRDRRGMVARALAGPLAWRVRLPAPLGAWAAIPGVVLVAVSNRLIAVSAADGRRVHTLTLDGRVADLALAPEGAVAILDDGTVYGLLPPGSPRHDVWLGQARLHLARAYLDAGKLDAARKVATAALVDDEHFYNARVLRAEIGTRTRDDSAVADWLALLETAPDDRTLATRARHGLQTLAGIREVQSIDARSVRTSSTWVVTRTSTGIQGRRPATPGVSVWTAPDAPLGPVQGPAIRVGERWLQLRDGAPVPPGLEPLGEDLYIERTAAPTLRRGDRWSRALPDGLTKVRWDGDDLLLFGPSRVARWSATTGEVRWTRRRRAPVEAMWRVGERVLLRTAGGLHAVDADNGRQRYRVSVGAGAPVVVLGPQAVFGEGTELKFLRADDGRLRGTLDVGARVVRLWSAGAYLFAALDSGDLVSVDPRRRRRVASAGLRVRDGAAIGNQLAVVDDAGRLLMIDGQRGLRPERQRRSRVRNDRR